MLWQEKKKGNPVIPPKRKVVWAYQQKFLMITCRTTRNSQMIISMMTGTIADGIRSGHPTRNVDKEDATGAGGYRN